MNIILIPRDAGRGKPLCLSHRHLLALFVVGVILLPVMFGIITYRLWSYTLDDAFISFRYARNFAEGHGIVFNPGERVEGYTNFLWVVILAVPFLLHVDPVPFAHTADVLLCVTATVLVYLIGRRAFFGGARPLAALPAALFLASPAVATLSATGRACASRAAYTTPKPPRPSTRSMRYPGTSG